MKLIFDVRRVLVCTLCATLVCSTVFAKTTKTTKTGIVTSISLDVKKDTVTVTLALGTLKEPSKNTAPVKSSNKTPPKRPTASDMIELSGETVTFTVAADTEVARSMMFAPNASKFASPAKDTTNASDTDGTTDDTTADDTALPPPPPFGNRPEGNPPMGTPPEGNPPEGTPPDASVDISDVSVNDVLTVSFDTDGTTVTSISEDTAEPPHGPNGMMGPRPDMNGNQGGPQGGFGGQGPQGGGMSGPSGGRR